MAKTTIAAHVHQTLDIQLNLRAKLTFDFVVGDRLTDTCNFIVRPCRHTLVMINAGFIQHLTTNRAANAEDVSERDKSALIFW
jgi:hypothetical protein